MNAHTKAAVPSFTSACLAWQLQESITSATATAKTMMMVASTTATAYQGGCPQLGTVATSPPVLPSGDTGIKRKRLKPGRTWSAFPLAQAILPKTTLQRAMTLQRHLVDISWMPGTLEMVVDGMQLRGTNLLDMIVAWPTTQLCLSNGRQQAMLAPHLHHANGQHGALWGQRPREARDWEQGGGRRGRTGV